mgnify:CR=1 FL=1
MAKINRKRKYDNFCGNFEIKTQPSLTQRMMRENKRLKIEVINLNERISLLETQLQSLSLIVKEIKKEMNKDIKNGQTDEIPSELKMFYYT